MTHNFAMSRVCLAVETDKFNWERVYNGAFFSDSHFLGYKVPTKVSGFESFEFIRENSVPDS